MKTYHTEAIEGTLIHVIQNLEIQLTVQGHTREQAEERYQKSLEGAIFKTQKDPVDFRQSLRVLKEHGLIAGDFDVESFDPDLDLLIGVYRK